MRRFTKQFGFALLIASSGFTIAASQINYNVPNQKAEVAVGEIAKQMLETNTTNPAIVSASNSVPLTKVEVKVLKQTPGGEVGETPEGSVSSSREYTLAAFMSAGVVRWGGYKFTYYSQRVLPGAGLRIPGRHVNADGYVCDADGYIVLAGSAAKGTVYPTPFGAPGKIYDRGTHGNHLDVYIR